MTTVGQAGRAYIKVARQHAARETTPEGRALAYQTAMEELKRVEVALSGLRRAEVRHLYAEGFSLAEISSALGLSRERVRQIIG